VGLLTEIKLPLAQQTRPFSHRCRTRTPQEALGKKLLAETESINFQPELLHLAMATASAYILEELRILQEINGRHGEEKS